MMVCTPSVFSRFRAVFLGFRWLLAVGGLLFLGLSSCENETSNRSSLAPKMEIEDNEPEKPTIDPILRRKIVYLNMSKFVIEKGKKGEEKLSEVLLKDGVVELQNIYFFASPDSEIRKILEYTRPFLTQDVIDKEAFDRILADYQAIKSKHLRSEERRVGKECCR